MAFKDDNWRPGSERRLILTIALTDPDTKRDSNYTTNPGASPTLRFCDQGDQGNGGIFSFSSNDYLPFISSFSGSHQSVTYDGMGSDADCNFSLLNKRYPWQVKHAAGGTETSTFDVRLSQLFADYLWQGAIVTATAVCKRLDGTTTSQQVFYGKINQLSASVNTVDVNCLADKTYIRLKPDDEGPGSSSFPSIVTDVGYPNAPISEIGKTVPIVYSAASFSPVLPSAGTLATDPTMETSSLYLTSLYQPVIADGEYNAAGSREARLLCSAYPTQSSAGAGGEKIFISLGDSRIAVLSSPSVTASTTEVYVDVATGQVALTWINPAETDTETNVTDTGQAYDGKDDTYAEVEYSGGNAELILTLPYIGSHGEITDTVGFINLAAGGTGSDTGAGASSVNGSFQVYNIDAAGTHASMTANLTKNNIEAGGYFETAAISAAGLSGEYWQSWEWAHDNAGTKERVGVRCLIDTASVSARVKAIGIKVTFRSRKFGIDYIASRSRNRTREEKS